VGFDKDVGLPKPCRQRSRASKYLFRVQSTANLAASVHSALGVVGAWPNSSNIFTSFFQLCTGYLVFSLKLSSSRNNYILSYRFFPPQYRKSV
jgi:hypothetical protein